MGRPRDLEARDRILKATHDLITTADADASINAIVARAGVGKATVYRWWNSRTAVVLDALVEVRGEPASPQQTDDPWADLRALVVDLAELVVGDTSALTRDLLGAVLRGDEEAGAIRELLLERGQQDLAAALQRGVDEGVLRKDLDVDGAVSAIHGSLWLRALSNEGNDGQSAEKVADELLEVLSGGLRPRV
ncbi:TetR/AcrR family transcriptional regulator [Euzebya rosea]|uniref:TetR/AcrR family transcriptional regulator n=1 Tax=Euzebya rosea TaxID=2052804 RepID=UPI000D3EDF55|nr:TetR/AcrR family transcriptional regulator [Euzebya rosea]